MVSSSTVEDVWQLVRSGLIDLDAITVAAVALEDPSAAIAAAASSSASI